MTCGDDAWKRSILFYHNPVLDARDPKYLPGTKRDAEVPVLDDAGFMSSQFRPVRVNDAAGHPPGFQAINTTSRPDTGDSIGREGTRIACIIPRYLVVQARY
jgi:hypothetical protein